MLDFYLLGLARSGTTSFCNSLNLHPRIYCALERFSIHVNPREITFPHSFISDSVPGPSLVREEIKRTVKSMAPQKLEQLIAGEKNPRKFYAPSHLKDVKSNICIYRTYSQACASWNVRAKNGQDLRWPEYRTGFFYFFDLLFFFTFTYSLSNTCWIDYQNLFFGDYESEIIPAIDSLGLLSEDYPIDLFKASFYRQISSKRSSSDDPRIENFAKLINLSEFEANYSHCSPIQRTQLVKEYGMFIASNLSHFLNNFVAQLTEFEFSELHLIADTMAESIPPICMEKILSADLTPVLKTFFYRTGSKKEHLQNIIRIAPHLYEPQRDLGRIYQKQGEYDAALREIKKAIVIRPNRLSDYIQLGNVYRALGEFSYAEATFRKALALDPKSHAACINLSRIYLQTVQLDKAIEFAKRAIELSPGNESYHKHLNKVLT